MSNKTALAMVFKLVEGAQKTWRILGGVVDRLNYLRQPVTHSAR
jgi:hypothetical protein